MIIVCHCRSFNLVSVRSLKPSWKKRQFERAEKKALQEYVRELKTAREQEIEVMLYYIYYLVQ